jgi:DNA adenine methylase
VTGPTRPALRYHGGKWKLAPWVIEHMPAHHIYVEAFGGAASVLLRKPRSYGEVYNDLDDEVVNVFRALRDPALAVELARRLALTPFARTEFKAAYTDPTDDLDRAYKMIVRSFMGFGSASMTRKHYTGFRSNSNRAGTTPAQDWGNWPRGIELLVERLRGVVIENREAMLVMTQHDTAETLHYVDPPYPQSTRSSLNNRNGNRGHYYRHDMTDDEHRALAAGLRELAGMVMVSGYRCPLYDDELYPDWVSIERRHMADGARPRIEVLWMNDGCADAAIRDRAQQHLALAP